MSEYIYFFEQVGDIWATQSPIKAKKVYDALSIRRLYQETTTDYINPVDDIIKKYICECYTKNNSELFTSDSKIIRSCLDKSLPKLTKESKKEYLALKNRMKKENNLIRLTKKQKEKIENLKKSSFTKIESELGKPSVN